MPAELPETLQATSMQQTVRCAKLLSGSLEDAVGSHSGTESSQLPAAEVPAPAACMWQSGNHPALSLHFCKKRAEQHRTLAAAVFNQTSYWMRHPPRQHAGPASADTAGGSRRQPCCWYKTEQGSRMAHLWQPSGMQVLLSGLWHPPLQGPQKATQASAKQLCRLHDLHH